MKKSSPDRYIQKMMKCTSSVCLKKSTFSANLAAHLEDEELM